MSMSTKPVAEKLLIKEGMRVLFVNAPTEYRSVIDSLPKTVTVTNSIGGPLDVVQVFVNSKRELQAQLGKLKTVLAPKGILWVSYPKGTSGMKVDINRDTINDYAHTVGLQGVAMISIDETWSALRLKTA